MKFIAFCANCKAGMNFINTECKVFNFNENQQWSFLRLDSILIISQVFSVFTTDAAICHKPPLHWINRQNTFAESEKRLNNFNITYKFQKDITKMLFGCNFYQKLVGTQQIWFNSWEQHR